MYLLPNISEKYYDVIVCCLERGDCANKDAVRSPSWEATVVLFGIYNFLL